MAQPLVILTLCFAAGIALAEAGGVSPSLGLISALALMLAMLVNIRRPGRGFFILVCLLSAVLGSFWLGLSELKGFRLAGFDGHYVDAAGTVISEGQVYPDREVYVLEVDSLGPQEGNQPVGEKALLTLTTEINPEGDLYPSQSVDPLAYRKPSLNYGDEVYLTGRVQIPREARNPGEFDYHLYLARKGIGTQIVSDPGEVRVLAEGSGFFLRRWALHLRGRVEGAAHEVLPPKQGGLLSAVLFGDRSGLQPEDIDLYQRLGLSHAFSVSGLHLTYVLGLSLLIAWGLRLSGVYHFAFNVLAMLFYAAMVGFPAATMRSLVMASLALGAHLWSRENNPLNGLALAGMVLLAGNPLLLFDAGFQLSFAATWGIVYLYPRMQDLAAGWPRWGQWLLLPLAAQLGILPLVAYYFNLVSLLSIVSNLVLMGLMGGIVIVGITSIPLVWLVPPLGEYFLLGAGALCGLADLLTRLFALVPGGVWHIGTPPLTVVLLYYVLLAAWGEGLLKREFRGVRLGRAALGITLMIALTLTIKSLFPQPLRVVFLDVGQGDCILVITPRGKNLLIDGGGRPQEAGGFDVGSRVVLPFLRREGIHRLELMVNTHPHDDHLNGLLPLVRELPVDKVVLPVVSVDNPKTLGLLDLCAARGVAWTGVRRGDYIDLEPGLRLEVLHPAAYPGAMENTQENENNHSLVMRLVYRDTAFLLTGDIEREGMREVLSSGVNFGSQVFKVPHHGSVYGLDREFLDRVGAKAAVISVGSNRFGHPAPDILRYWQEKNLPLFRTDEKGAIIVTSDGEQLEVTTQLEGVKYGCQ